MKKVGLVQINNSFSGQNYFPYSTGLLQVYAQAHCPRVSEYEFIDPIYKRLSVSTAVDHLQQCDIVGFSAYVWNERISLRIASELKKINPDCLVVFGGPQVPDNPELWLRSNPYVDLAVHGEGEHVFTTILDKYNGNNRSWAGVPAVSYISDGNLVKTAKVGRFKTLDEVPSPYLNGAFDSIMAKNPSEQWLALWETNRGCPFQCTYCDWGSAIQVKISKFAEERLYKEVEWFADHRIEFVFCCDANYGILVRDVDITKYVVKTKKAKGYPKALSVQNTKNATDRSYEVQKLLSDAGLNKGVTLSVQSMDQKTLENIRRDNISLASYQELQKRFMRDKVETYSDMILALPGETYESFIEGMNTIITNGQHNRIQFNNLSILPNAEMGNPEYQKKFGMETITSDIINFHGSLDEEKDDPSIREKQVLVIGTNSMPKEDWLKTRSYCWMAALLHFDKIFQIPIILTHKQTGIRYRDIFSAFMDENYTKNYPILDEIRRFFVAKALDIQTGGAEYCEAKEWLNIWWPADEYTFIKLTVENKIHDFYDEAGNLLRDLIHNLGKPIDENALTDAIALNHALLKIPFLTDDITLTLRYDIMKFYRGSLEDNGVVLEKIPTKYNIERSKAAFTDWNLWFKEVVWYGNKKGAYLHGNWETEYQLSGHY